MRSSRQVHAGTPRVLGSSADTATTSGSRGSSRRSATGRQSTNSARSSARSSAQDGRRSSSARRSVPVKKKRGIGFVLLIVLLIVVLLAGGFTALYFSQAFAITNVEVAGNEKLQSSYVLDLADVSGDSTILRTDVDGIRHRLLTEPWIQDVEVERVFPSTLVLHVTERPIAAVVDIVPETANDTMQQWIIAEDGTWISPVDTESNEEVEINAEEFVKLPKIKDVSAAVRPESGVKETDGGITNALALLQGFSPEMRDMVASISAPDAVKTNLTLYNNVGVAFGVAEDIEAKEKAIATLLAEHEGTITLINVRVADRATYRATE